MWWCGCEKVAKIIAKIQPTDSSKKRRRLDGASRKRSGFLVNKGMKLEEAYEKPKEISKTPSPAKPKATETPTLKGPKRPGEKVPYRDRLSGEKWKKETDQKPRHDRPSLAKGGRLNIGTNSRADPSVRSTARSQVQLKLE
jgi:hypothetical protein